MNFLELVQSRQSVRTYADKPVEKEKLYKCLETARLSPSACNSQPWRFIIVDEPNLKDKVAKSTFGEIISFNKFSVNAPVLVVITANKSCLKTNIGEMITDLPYYLIDIGIAAEHFCLQATVEGLGTCMMGWFKEKEVKKHLNIPKNERVVLIISIGYPKVDTIRPKNRKSIDKISSFNDCNL
jgi:nitroreductase